MNNRIRRFNWSKLLKRSVFSKALTEFFAVGFAIFFSIIVIELYIADYVLLFEFNKPLLVIEFIFLLGMAGTGIYNLVVELYYAKKGDGGD